MMTIELTDLEYRRLELPEPDLVVYLRPGN